MAATKLTRRQAEFVDNLVSLNQLLDGPIHYSVLAEHIGVSPFTAYDMLRVLEEKGLVRSEYHLPEDRQGPGRAERVFFATVKGREQRRHWLEQTAVEPAAALPTIISSAQLCGHDALAGEVAEEVLSRVAARSGVSRYGVELVPLIAWRLRKHAGRLQLRAIMQTLLPLDQPATRADLTLFGGVVLGFLSSEQDADPQWLSELGTHIQRYQAHVLALDETAAQQLGRDIRAALEIMWTRLEDQKPEATLMQGAGRTQPRQS